MDKSVNICTFCVVFEIENLKENLGIILLFAVILCESKMQDVRAAHGI